MGNNRRHSHVNKAPFCAVVLEWPADRVFEASRENFPFTSPSLRAGTICLA